MPYTLFAEAVVAFHFAFVLFVVLGGLLVWRWPRLAWLHLPCAVWGVLVEATGLICPLTPLEAWLRQRAGLALYEGGFIAHYLLRLLYPSGLTRGIQLVLGALVLALNGAIYAGLIRRWKGQPLGGRQRE
ncbi:MAG TPA: DUF2784 domain-containing protein [Thermoanaerobaculia bacterium]|jgi:hypothetical protein|nr:DUF2784 domain-containing protein [Thermoanaerobaculia bacterium]